MLVSSWGLFRNYKSGQHVRVFKALNTLLPEEPENF